MLFKRDRKLPYLNCTLYLWKGLDVLETIPYAHDLHMTDNDKFYYSVGSKTYMVHPSKYYSIEAKYFRYGDKQ